MLLCVLFFASVCCMGLPQFSRWQLAAANSCVDEGVDPGFPLLLSPYVQSGSVLQARALAKAGLHGKDLGYSGFLSAPSASGKNTNNLFFWYQPCTACANISAAPLLLFLQGGPGAPSTYGSLQEIGPVYIDKNCKVQTRTYSWCNPTSSCMFIDNPVQTGFSYQVNASGQNDPKNIEYTRTSADAAKQMVILLNQFFKIFPEVQSSPFWITGESYGGNYVPNLAKAILDTSSASINLKGISVGDPVMNSAVQWPTYADTLYGMGLVNLLQREQIRSIMYQGVQALQTGTCKEAFDFWNSVWNDNGEAPSPFYYQQFSGSSTTYEQLLVNDPESMAWSINWLATSQVQKALHYGRSPANQQNEGGPVYDTMVESGDFCQNSSDIFGDLLVKYGIHVQIYSSTNDPLLGPPCTEAGIIAALTRVGVLNQYLNAPRVLWSDSQGLNGYATCFTYAPKGSRFCFPVVRNAGHMAPSFQPRACADMTYRFVNNIPFSGSNPNLPSGPQCGGSPPFTGSADCACTMDRKH